MEYTTGKIGGWRFKSYGDVFSHKDGTIEDWYTIQRTTVYFEDKSIEALNVSVIDVHKGNDGANDENGSKIMVVPFDGEAFGKHIREIVDKENMITDKTPQPAPWQSVDIGDVQKKGNAGFDKVVNTIRLKATGNKLDSKKDAFNFTNQKKRGDILVKTFLLSDEISGGDIQSGLMMRKSLDADAPFAFASFIKNEGFAFKERSAKSDKVSILKTKKINAPYWIMLRKSGNKITCYLSTSNRMNWEEIGDANMDLDDEFYVGMASSSNGSFNKSMARFKDTEAYNYGNPTESGTQKLVYDAGKPLNPDYTYWFVIKVVQMHFHDSEHFDAGFKKVFVK